MTPTAPKPNGDEVWFTVPKHVLARTLDLLDEGRQAAETDSLLSGAWASDSAQLEHEIRRFIARRMETKA